MTFYLQTDISYLKKCITITVGVVSETNNRCTTLVKDYEWKHRISYVLCLFLSISRKTLNQLLKWNHEVHSRLWQHYDRHSTKRLTPEATKARAHQRSKYSCATKKVYRAASSYRQVTTDVVHNATIMATVAQISGQASTLTTNWLHYFFFLVTSSVLTRF